MYLNGLLSGSNGGSLSAECFMANIVHMGLDTPYPLVFIDKIIAYPFPMIRNILEGKDEPVQRIQLPTLSPDAAT